MYFQVQVAAYYGYPAETHKVHTKDRYILTLFRIPSGRKSVAKGKHAGECARHRKNHLHVQSDIFCPASLMCWRTGDVQAA